MLFNITDKIIDNLETQKDHSSDLLALERIALAYWNGNHLVFANPQVLERLKEFDFQKAFIKEIFRELYNKFPQTKSYLSSFSRRIDILPGVHIFRRIGDADNFRLEISTDYIATGSIASKLKFISENPNDTKIFSTISNVYKIRNNLGQFRLDFEPIHGGGSDIYEQFLNYASYRGSNRTNLCLCIIDGDKSFPNDKSSDSVRKFKQLNRRKCENGEFNILDQREMENLLPTKMLKEKTAHHMSAGNLKILEGIEKLSPESRKYFDFKNGIKRFELLDASMLGGYKKYWKGIFKKVDSSIIRSLSHCKKSNPCLNKKDCDKYVIKGFGKAISKKRLKEIFSNSKIQDYLVKNSSADDLSSWKSISKIVLAWACASYPSRVKLQ